MGEAGDALAEKIGTAVEEWLAERGGGMVAGYSMLVNYYDEEGEICWASAYADRQTPAQTLGMLRWQTISVEHIARRYFERTEED